MLALESSLPRFRVGPIGIVIACIPLVLIMYWLLGNPDANFRSSDLSWAKAENSFKAHDFDVVAWKFEIYRLKCQAGPARLIRTTKMHWWNIFAWHSYATDPKWNVPYGVPYRRIGASFPLDPQHCSNQGLTNGETALIEQRSADLVRTFARGA